MTAYCEAADLYAYGVPRGGIPNPARLVAAVSTSSETMSLEGHGFADGTALLFRAESGGSLPAPLVEGTTYYAKVITESTFQVAATVGGSAINLTSAGSNVLVVSPISVTACIAWASEVIDEALVGVDTPLSLPVGETIKAACADLAAWRLLSLSGGDVVDFAAKKASVDALLDRWRRGVSVKSAPARAGTLAVRGGSAAGISYGTGYLP